MYIGKSPNLGQLYNPDRFSGTGSQTTFTLTNSVTSDQSVIVCISGVKQQVSNYSITGSSLVFDTAPPSGTNNIEVQYLGSSIDVGTVGDSAIDSAKIASDAITTAKIADNQITAPKTDLSIVQGDVIYGSGTDAWARLGAGTSGQFLKTQGAGANPVWADATHTGNVAFPATQVASADANTLDDYEEGLFTPTLEGASSSGTTATGTGYYTKIGRLVNVGVRFGNVAVSGGSGEAKISGLPFSVSTVASGAYGVCFPMTYKVTHRGQIDGFYTAGTALYGLSSFSTTGWSGWAFSDFYGNGNIYINLSVSYITT